VKDTSRQGWHFLTSFPIKLGNETSEEQYPELEQIMGGYFHQDWFDEFRDRGENPSKEIVLQQMLLQKSVSRKQAAVGELERLLASTRDEETLRQVIVHDMGAQVNPRLDGSTMHAWLEHIADLLRESLQQKA